jgi:protein SCO1/2
MRRIPLVSLIALSTLLLAATATGCSRPHASAHVTRAAGDHAGHAGHAPAAPAAVSVDSSYSVYDLVSVWRDQRGDDLALTELAGKVRVVAMVYTSCQATCPLIVGDLKRIESSLPADRRDDVGFVLVSLDPDRDTPGRLAAWAAETRLDPARWMLLNGDDSAVRELAATLGVRYRSLPDGELAHTNAITVLDRAGRVAYQQPGLGDESGATAAAVTALLH